MGESIAHYNVLERLGTGALGDVYRARDMKVGRTVALMTPSPALVEEPDRRMKFLEDARLATALNHPNIATLFDVVEKDGRSYLAYEFAAGPSLREEMGGRPVNVRRAVELTAQIADALAEGHSRGLVHGDVRPENVVVTPKGSPKILNFGLSTWTDGGRARRAAASAEGLGSDPHGVAAYLSPEQAIGATIDARSDLFSLGVVLYEMVTGRNPFAAPTPAATLVNVTRLPASPPSAANKALPAELDALIARVLAKSLEARPQSAVSLAADLRSLGTALDRRAGESVPTELIPVDRGDRSPWVFVAIVCAVLLVALWVWLRGLP
jgi:serine/threonine protein kinase